MVLDHVYDACQALERLRAGQRYAVIGVDLNLPGTYGCELVATLKRERLAEVPVVVFASSRQLVDQRRALAAGADRFADYR